MRIFKLIFSMLCCIVLSSCNLPFDVNESSEYKTPDQQAKELETKIISCFIDKDVKTLKSLFCSYIKENYNELEFEIEKAINFFDGKIITSDDPFSSASGSVEQKDYGASVNVTTEKGTIYNVSFKGWLSNDNEPDRIGINVLVVKNISLNGDEIRIKYD